MDKNGEKKYFVKNYLLQKEGYYKLSHPSIIF